MLKNLIILLALCVCSFTTEAPRITQSGFANFLLDKMPLSTLLKLYPPGAGHQTRHYGDVEAIYIPDHGVELFFTHKDGLSSESTFLNQIDITSPCYARTEKNIRIGSTVEEVLQQYGSKKDYERSGILIYDWIQFYIDKGHVSRISISAK